MSAPTPTPVSKPRYSDPGTESAYQWARFVDLSLYDGTSPGWIQALRAGLEPGKAPCPYRSGGLLRACFFAGRDRRDRGEAPS